MFLSLSIHGQEPIPPTRWKGRQLSKRWIRHDFPLPARSLSDKINIGLTLYTIRVNRVAALSIRNKPAPNCASELAAAIHNLQGITAQTSTVAGATAYAIEKSKEGSRSYERFWCGDKKLFVGSLRWPADEPIPPSRSEL